MVFPSEHKTEVGDSIGHSSNHSSKLRLKSRPEYVEFVITVQNKKPGPSKEKNIKLALFAIAAATRLFC